MGDFWCNLSPHWKNATILIAAISFGISVGAWGTGMIGIPERMVEVERKAQAAIEDRASIRHELEEINGKLDDAGRIRCWMIARQLPNVVPPPECENGHYVGSGG